MTYYVGCIMLSLWLHYACWIIKCLEYILMSLFVTVDAPNTRPYLTNFLREHLIILHLYKGTNVVHRLTINLLRL